MAEERTLLILKPDAVQRGIAGKIISRFEDKGFTIVGMKLIKIDDGLAAKHYAEHKGKKFYDGLVKYMTSSPVIVICVEGPRVIGVSRKMCGATFGFNAEPGTIRGDFSASTGFNTIHASDSAESAKREIELYFGKGELVEWTPARVATCFNDEDKGKATEAK